MCGAEWYAAYDELQTTYPLDEESWWKEGLEMLEAHQCATLQQTGPADGEDVAVLLLGGMGSKEQSYGVVYRRHLLSVLAEVQRSMGARSVAGEVFFPPGGRWHDYEASKHEVQRMYACPLRPWWQSATELAEERTRRAPGYKSAIAETGA